MSIKVIINDQEISCEKGERLIDVAEREGNYIPRFCYHPALSVVASCRMCLVEVEGIPKSQPACATLVSEGMVVKTQSKKVIQDQKAIMQFLLVNHPLHCPICDQGGECDLQDTAMGYGLPESEMKMEKRTIEDEDLGPLIATDMSLCIHCTRCVRFGHEIAGIPDLGLMGRSDEAAISTYLSKGVRSELSGNMIDLCPVGALTSKPAKFRGRSWGFRQKASLSPHDNLGAHLYYHILPKGYDHLADIMRVVPKANPKINEIWLSDRDRFSYEGIQVKGRLKVPHVKRRGKWEAVSFEEALLYIVSKLKMLSPEDKLKSGAWFSTQMTLEEGFFAQAMFRALGIHNLDYRVTEYTEKREDSLKPCPMDLQDIKTFDTVVLLGCNIRYEQPLMAYQIKEAVKVGTQVLSLGAIEHDYAFSHDCQLIPPQQLADKVFSQLFEKKGDFGDKVLFILGEEALTHPLASDIKRLVQAFCQGKDHVYCQLTRGPNALGLKGVGCLPSQGAFLKSATEGLSYSEMLDTKMHTMWLHQIDPLEDVSHRDKAISMLKEAFVISLSSYDTPGVREVSDVMLPIALPAENAGHYVNYQGVCQKFEQAVRPYGESKMGLPLYDILATLLDINDVQDPHLGEKLVKQFNKINWEVSLDKPKKPKSLSGKWISLGLRSWVDIDAQLRHAKSLQALYATSFEKLSHPKEKGCPIDAEPSDKVAKRTVVGNWDGHYYQILEDKA